MPLPDDNQVPTQLAAWLGQTPKACSLICEGGGLETNGEILLVNQDCIVDDARNPGSTCESMADMLREWLGVTEIEWLQGIQLTGDDTDGHIDTIARFVAPDAIVYSGKILSTQTPKR